MNFTDKSRFTRLLINPFTSFLEITYRKIVDVTNPKIKECVIPLCEKMNKFGDKIPIHATNIVSKSGEIPPKPPASLFLFLTAYNIMYGTKKCVIKSNFSPNIYFMFRKFIPI